MTAARRAGSGRLLIGVVVVLFVLTALVVVAELIARQMVPAQIRSAVVERLELPADHPMEVEVDGILIPQLIVGRLDHVRVASQDVAVGAFTGDVVAQGEEVPIRGGAPAAGGSAELRMTTEQLRSLLSTIDGFPAETVELDAPNVTASADVELLGAALPLGIALEPGVADGDIVLTPVEAQIADATVTADELRDRFGGLVDPLLEDRRLCIASSVPAAMTLQSIEVAGEELVARFDIDGGIIDDPALQENGTC